MGDNTLNKTVLDPSKIQGYSRNGLQIQTQPIPEYLRFYAQGLRDNQTAIFTPDFDFSLHSLIVGYPNVSSIDGIPPDAQITITIKQSNKTIWTHNSMGFDALDGVIFPSIPFQKDNIEIHCIANKAIDFLWLNVRQCKIIDLIPPSKTI